VTRAEAVKAALHKYPDGRRGCFYGAYLRNLNGRLVWLAAIRDLEEPILRLTAFDAQTGRLVDEHAFPLVTE
jgi:hypothetical protein